MVIQIDLKNNFSNNKNIEITGQLIDKLKVKDFKIQNKKASFLIRLLCLPVDLKNSRSSKIVS